MGSMKEKNRRKWWSSGRRGDRSKHGSEIRCRYAVTHRTASPSEPCGAATAVTTGAGLTAAAVACCVEGVCVSTIGSPSDGGAPAVRSAAPATTRRVGRIRQYYVGSERVFGIRTIQIAANALKKL